MNPLLSKVSTFIRSNLSNFLVFIVFFIAISLLIRLYWQTQIDENWDQFIIDHHCQKIAKESSNNHRTGWRCDDGETYYRWRQQS